MTLTRYIGQPGRHDRARDPRNEAGARFVVRDNVREAPVYVQVVAHWFCDECEVEGRDAVTEPTCWNCGGAVTVIARPAVPSDLPRDDAA
jgi:hypothetical protein